MKYIIFGTGKYCEERMISISNGKIVCFIDNDAAKHGRVFHGKEVYSVERGLQEEYDYVVILVKRYSDVIRQLVSSGVPQNKIVTYDRLWMLEDIPQHLTAQKGEKTIQEWIQNRSGVKIFVCSHDFSRSGVPVALMNLSVLLRKMNYHVFMAAMRGGALEQELSEHKMDFICGLEDQYLNEMFMDQLKGFDVIVLGTLALVAAGQAFTALGVPVLWWIHESEQKYYQDHLPVNKGNIFYFGVGSRVLKKFRECYPKEEIGELHYSLPDVSRAGGSFLDRRTFAVIGAFGERKAQDLLMDAVQLLPESIRDICFFYFVGAADHQNRRRMDDFCRQYEQVYYVSELSQAEMSDFYTRIDVLVCPSRDDPMPIVVTQAMQNGVPCLISDQVGQCEYVRASGGGVVFPSEDVTALKQSLMTAALWTQEEWKQYSAQAKEIFRQYFSEQVMRGKMEEILSLLLCKK